MDRALYEEHAALERDHWWFIARRAILEHLLAQRLPPASARRLLDVGCGTGGMLPMLARFGQVEGIEGEPIAVASCHERFPDFEVRLGTIPTEVPTDASFDVVTAFDVIEHIADDEAAVDSLRQACAIGGTVLLTVPALMSLWSDHDEVNGHHRRYNRSTLSAVVRASGLRLDHLSFFNTALLPAVAAARLAQRVRPPHDPPTSDFSMAAPRVNRALTRVMTSERGLVNRPGLPVGVSLVALTTRTS